MRRCVQTVVTLLILTTSSCQDMGVEPKSEWRRPEMPAPPKLPHVLIRTDSVVYDLVESNSGVWTTFIRSTLTTGSPGDTFFSRLGDGMSPLLDQNELFVAEGSDGFIEMRQPGGEWIARSRGVMIEGVRVVALRPSRRYNLTAYLRWQNPDTGSFRISVNYYRCIDSVGAGSPLIGISNTFSVR